MRWLLDSNVLIDALAGLPHGVHVLRGARNRPEIEIMYSAISRVEILGFPGLSEQEEIAVRSLLDEFDEIPISAAVIERTIQIRKSIRIKIPDALIAASAQIARASIITRNVNDFERVAGITVVHPDDV